jgi:hypothetical protein
MTEFEAEHFLETMRGINKSDEVTDLADAIFFARRMVPMIDKDTYYGEILLKNGEAAGVFHSTNYKSCWFPSSNLETVSKIIRKEFDEIYL